MFIRRVHEILNTSDTVNVVYQNNPVWIEDVDNNRETAYVRFLDSSSRLEVPIIDLIEIEKNKR